MGLKKVQKILLNIFQFHVFFMSYTHFFISNPIVQLSLQLLSEVPKNEAESCYEVAYVFDDYWLKFGK